MNKLKCEEKKMNLTMFLFMVVVPIVAYGFVMLFLGGTQKDCIVLLMVVASILVRLLEKRLGALAKYFYVSILPFFGAIVIVVDGDGRYSAMTQAYLFTLLLSIAYYNVSVVKVNVVVTLVSNIVALILFPKTYLNMHSLLIWSFICIVYLLSTAAALIIATRMHTLFATVEEKEEMMKQVLDKENKEK